jgi:hypothetical protein
VELPEVLVHVAEADERPVQRATSPGDVPRRYTHA